jgi:hypothetical protein
MTKGRVNAKGAIAVVMACALVLSTSLAPASAAAEKGSGLVRGSVYGPDGLTKLAGAKVTAVNVRTGTQYVSPPTGPDGEYEIDGLPAGSYDLVVEMVGSVFVADHLVDLAPGETYTQSYSVQPARPANRVIPGLPAPKGSVTVVGQEQPSAVNFWRSPGGIALIGVLSAGAAAAIYNAVHNENGKGSPSAP